MSSPSGVVILDSSVVIAICANEAGREPKASAELSAYAASGHVLYAPGVLFSEALYVLCRKLHDGTLTAQDYAQALTDLDSLAGRIQPPPGGDASLVNRAAAIAQSYGCSRSADAIYITLAEALAASIPTVLLTFDADLPKQVAANAPSVIVRLLAP